MEKANYIAYYTLQLVIILFVSHIVIYRFNKKYKFILSDLLLIIIIGLVENFLFLLEYLFFNHGDFLHFEIIYIFLLFNIMLYCYMQFFNMSETARRIRIITLAYLNDKKIHDTNLNINDSIEMRLTRLLNLKQIKTDGHKYSISSKILLKTSMVINLIREILGIDYKY